MQLGQAGLILRRIGEASQGFAQPPLTIFTGDFNSTPESAVYTFVRDGELDCYTEDRRNLSGQLEREEKGWPPSSIASSRNFNLRAALVGQDRIRVSPLGLNPEERSFAFPKESQPTNEAVQDIGGPYFTISLLHFGHL